MITFFEKCMFKYKPESASETLPDEDDASQLSSSFDDSASLYAPDAAYSQFDRDNRHVKTINTTMSLMFLI